MKNQLIEYFSRITPLTAEERSALAESMVIKHFGKDVLMVKEGQLHNDTFFICEGLVRQYRIVEGEEITTNFYSTDQWIISLSNFTVDTYSPDNLVCIEPTTVVIGNEAMAQALFKQFPRFETVSRMVMERVFAEQISQMNNYLTSTPEQRYLRLLKTNPDIVQRVPQYHLASYIGVKPESLSRIRKRIASRG